MFNNRSALVVEDGLLPDPRRHGVPVLLKLLITDASVFVDTELRRHTVRQQLRRPWQRTASNMHVGFEPECDISM